MSGNAKFRWFLLVPIVLTLLVVTSPVSWAGELGEAQTFDQLRNAIEKSISAEEKRQQQAQTEEESTPQSEKGSGKKLEDAQERVRQNPNDAKAHRNLAYAYHELGQYQDAIVSYKEAIRIKPYLSKPHNGLGNAYHNLGQYQDALVSYKEAIRLNPDDAFAHHNLGHTYRSLGKSKEAIASLKEAIRIKPDYAVAHIILA